MYPPQASSGFVLYSGGARRAGGFNGEGEARAGTAGTGHLGGAAHSAFEGQRPKRQRALLQQGRGGAQENLVPSMSLHKRRKPSLY